MAKHFRKASIVLYSATFLSKGKKRLLVKWVFPEKLVGLMKIWFCILFGSKDNTWFTSQMVLCCLGWTFRYFLWLFYIICPWSVLSVTIQRWWKVHIVEASSDVSHGLHICVFILCCTTIHSIFLHLNVRIVFVEIAIC